jgi:NADH-quinone oxidoreductase subunit J
VNVVLTKNIIHSAISLFIALFGIAGIYVLLYADFIAVTQIMVYIGGILILLIFGIMLTTKITNLELTTKNLNIIPSIIFVTVMTVMIMLIIRSTQWKVVNNPSGVNETIGLIGNALLNEYLLPFEVASVVLLVALIGAAMYARKEKTK